MPPTAPLCKAIDRQPAADVKKLIDLLQRTLEDHCPGRFGRDVAALAEGDADRGRRQGRRVVDAISHEDRVALAPSRSDQLQLLLGALARVNLRDADLIGQVPHLRLAVAGNQQDAVEAVLGPQVADEVGTVARGWSRKRSVAA